MADWFVARSGQQQGPFSFDTLRAMASGGEFTRDDAVWREGMSQWVRAGDLSELSSFFTSHALSTAATPIAYSQPFSEGGVTTLTPRGMDMLRQTAPWVRLFGVLIFVFAGFAAVGCLITLIAGIAGLSRGGSNGVAGVVMLVMTLIYAGVILLYLMPGIYLNRYASRINALVGGRREDQLEQALEAQKSFWKFVGVLMLISIGLWLLMVVAMFVIGMSASRSSTYTFPNQPTPPVFPQPQNP